MGSARTMDSARSIGSTRTMGSARTITGRSRRPPLCLRDPQQNRRFVIPFPEVIRPGQVILPSVTSYNVAQYLSDRPKSMRSNTECEKDPCGVAFSFPRYYRREQYYVVSAVLRSQTGPTKSHASDAQKCLPKTLPAIAAATAKPSPPETRHAPPVLPVNLRSGAPETSDPKTTCRQTTAPAPSS